MQLKECQLNPKQWKQMEIEGRDVSCVSYINVSVVMGSTQIWYFVIRL